MSDWASLFQTGLSGLAAIGAAITAVIANGHSQKMKNLVAQVTPIAQAVQAATPVVGQVLSAVTAPQTTVQKVEAVEQTVAPIVAAIAGPEAAPILGLIEALTQAASALTAATHKPAVLQPPGQPIPVPAAPFVQP